MLSSDDIYYADSAAVAALMLNRYRRYYDGSEVINLRGYPTYCYRFIHGSECKKDLEEHLGVSIFTLTHDIRSFVAESKESVKRLT